MSDLDNLNLVASTQSDIYSKLMYIAGKYVNTNADFLRSGLFGYMTESMAMIMRDSSIHKTILYNESFLNTAVIPKSIYNWAKTFNINLTGATPAYADITITLAVNDFNSYKKQATRFVSKYGNELAALGSTNVLIIDKETPFIAGDFTFMLEHSLLIQQNTNNGGYTARYLIQEPNVTTSYQSLTSPILPVIFNSDEYGEEYISFQARVYQYKIETTKKIITSNSFIDRKIHEFEFSDQYVSASLSYTKGAATQDIDLFFSNIGINSSNPYAFYNLIDTNKIQIKFADGVGLFKPSANSTLTIKILTTKGAAGNIAYSGNVICQLSDESLRNLPLSVRFTSYQAAGGLDSLTLSEIKQKIVNEISTRDIIVTETDLNNYFTILTALMESINNGSIKFVKKRDDILRRSFSAYVLIRDIQATEGSVSNIYTVPTNTFDVEAPIINNMSIPCGAPVVAMPENKTKHQLLINSGYNLTDLKDDFYICPFYMYVSLDPIRRVKYIYNMANDSTSLSYRSIGSAIGNHIIIPSNVSIYRGMSATGGADESYELTFTFTTDFDISKLKAQQTGSLELFFTTVSGNAIVATPTLSYDIDDDDIITLESDKLDESTGVRQSKIKLKLKVADNDSVNEFSFDGSNNSSTSYGGYITLMPGASNSSSLTYNLPEQVTPVLSLKNLILDDQIISISFQGDSPLTLFQNLDDIMSSDMTVNSQKEVDPETGKLISETVSSIILQDVPLIHSSYLEYVNDDTFGKFISQLFTYINMLKENTEKLETSTFFNLKFYGTHGVSQQYNTTTTDLDLEMTIRLKPNVSVAEHIDSIRSYVLQLVDISNNDKALKISHIIAATISKFVNIIENIDFEGINGTFTQHIKLVDSNSQMTSAPEHFNIPRENIKHIKVVDYNGLTIEE